MNYESLLEKVDNMRGNARTDGKTVPDREQLFDLFARLDGMRCPACRNVMTLKRGAESDRCASLQHDRSGEIKIICNRCNSRHSCYPGDAFYTTPEGYKYCKHCDTIKPVADFCTDNNKKSVSKLKAQCRSCAKAVWNRWFSSMPQERKSKYYKKKWNQFTVRRAA